MTIHRLLLLSIFWLLVSGTDGNTNAALPRHTQDGEAAQSTNSTNSTNRGQPDMSLGITANRGALGLKAGAGAVVSNMRLRLRHGDGSVSTLYELELAGQEAGQRQGRAL
jgi:hypothetical protein